MQRRRGAAAVKHAIDNLDDAIAATQLGITLASLALGWVGEPSMAALVAPLVQLPAERRVGGRGPYAGHDLGLCH